MSLMAQYMRIRYKAPAITGGNPASMTMYANGRNRIPATAMINNPTQSIRTL